MDASQGVLLSSSLVGGAKGSASWPELLGSAHWEGLLDPLDLTLRRLILLRAGPGQVPAVRPHRASENQRAPPRIYVYVYIYRKCLCRLQHKD
jgi:hypothetical protein